MQHIAAQRAGLRQCKARRLGQCRQPQRAERRRRLRRRAPRPPVKPTSHPPDPARSRLAASARRLRRTPGSAPVAQCLQHRGGVELPAPPAAPRTLARRAPARPASTGRPVARGSSHSGTSCAVRASCAAQRQVQPCATARCAPAACTSPMPRTVSIGSSARAVPAPTITASWRARIACTSAARLRPGDPLAFAGGGGDAPVETAWPVSASACGRPARDARQKPA